MQQLTCKNGLAFVFYSLFSLLFSFNLFSFILFSLFELKPLNFKRHRGGKCSEKL